MASAQDKLLDSYCGKSLAELKQLASVADLSCRSSNGETLLHRAVAENVKPEIFKFLLDHVDFSVRDAFGNTVADLIFTANLNADFENMIVNHVKAFILQGKVEQVEKLLLSGWTFWPIAKEQARNVSPELEEFVCNMPDLQEKVAMLHHVIGEGNLRDIKNLLDRKKLILAADRTGLPPFHKAVISGNPEIVEWLIQEFKFALEQRDHMGRTVLHYAAGLPDAGYVYAMLCNAGANEDAVDTTGRKPRDYYDDTQLLGIMGIRQRIKDILENPIPEPKLAVSGQTSHHMYINSNIKAKRVPPPTTIDGKYVAEHLGTALTLALAEIAECRPWDPIEYLGQWLYKYKKNKDFVDNQEKLMVRLQEEEKSKLLEREEKEKIRQEQKEIMERERKEREKEEEERKRKEQEELQRQAREMDALAQRPNLDTVTEEGEEEATGKDKDGQTELHKLAAQEGADITALLNLGYNLADRDASYKTPRDIAVEKGVQENVNAIDNYLKGLIEKEKFSMLEQLLLDGYRDLQPVIDKLSPEGQSEEVKTFLQSIPETQTKITSVLESVQKGDISGLQEVLDQKLASSKDPSGRSPLHIAVLGQHKDVTEHIINGYPESVKCRDHLNRTPYHYAMGMPSEEIQTFLLSHGADDKAKDVRQRLPAFYKENPSEIQAMMGGTQQSSGQQEIEPQQSLQLETTPQENTDTTPQQDNTETTEQTTQQQNVDQSNSDEQQKTEDTENPATTTS